MSLVAFGINHKTAPLAVRERLVFQSSRLLDALTTLKGQTAANEAVLLSTCNRTELYADEGSAQQFVQWLSSQSGVAPADVQNNGYFYHECAALRHLLRVASGLDSMVLGEPQIFGQMKEAYFQADQAGGVQKQFRALFPHVFQVTKQIRQQTNIGRNPITLGYAVMHLAKQHFPVLKNTRVLLVGTGEMTELMLSYFERHEMRQIYVASRHIQKASALLKNKQGYPIRMGAIPDYLKHVDLVISATSSQLPIIGKGMVERIGQGGRTRHKVFVDLAVPRDIEPEVGHLRYADLYNLDDLQQIIDANLHSRSLAAEQAEVMIVDQAHQFYKKQQVQGVSHAIRQFRCSVERFRDQELKESLKLLEQGRDPEQVVSILARGLTNKMLHLPTVKLRQAAYDGNMELLTLVKELFEVE